MDDFNFVAIEKSIGLGFSPFPDRLSITKSTFSIRKQAANSFRGYAEDTNPMNGRGSRGKCVKLRIDYDEARKAIRLTPDRSNGYSFSVEETTGIHRSMTTHLRETIAEGMYKPVEGRTNIYQLVTE